MSTCKKLFGESEDVPILNTQEIIQLYFPIKKTSPIEARYIKKRKEETNIKIKFPYLKTKVEK